MPLSLSGPENPRTDPAWSPKSKNVRHTRGLPHGDTVRERDLPAHVAAYYVIALALYMRSSYREVLRCLREGVQWLLNPPAAVKVAGKSGISQARRPLGPELLKKLYEVIVAPIAERQTKGAWYRGWRLISLDGSALDTADTEENEKAFGRPGANRRASAFPKIRFWRTGQESRYRLLPQPLHHGSASSSRSISEGLL
jgi:hypothetical protein